jgi:TolB-like protein
MGAIFLSYAREDRRCAEQIARILGKAGHEVWWDRHIGTGREFASEIESQLAKADVVLVAWSASAAKSPWVRDEAAIGRDRGRLLPVLVDGGEPPIGFRQFQALDLSGWKGRANDRRTKALVGAVDAMRRGSAAPAVWPRRGSAWLRERRVWALAGALALIVAAAIGLLIVRPGAAEAEPASLAVLPFKNISKGDPYFAEGVAEEIANQLGREPQFTVAGRTSSALFKDAADFREVGRKLHVAYVLEGSVRTSGNEVRVIVSLVDARKGARRWSRDFRGKLDDIFAIQDNIGRQVAASVKRQLVAKGPSAMLTTTGEVYTLYVTARSLMHQREPSKIRLSIDLLRQAVKLDPDYAPAWARLALALNLWEYYGTGGGSTKAERVRYAERAVALAPQYGDGHAVLGLLLAGDEELDASRIRRGREELEKAVRLNPGDSDSWYWLHYSRLNDLEFELALDALRRTATIDPFFILNSHYPNLAWDMGYRRDSISFFQNWITDHPDPFVRELARGGLAGMKNDLSANYLYAKKAREIASPDAKPIAEGVMGSILMQLRLLDQADRIVPRNFVDLRRGKLASAKALRETFPRAIDFWNEQQEPRYLPKLFVTLGRFRDIVGLYDEAFPTPENMASRLSKPAFVNLAPLVAISLQRAHRTREGARVLLLADAMCVAGTKGTHSPMKFRVSCSRLWSVLGRKELAIRTLERAVSEGWFPRESDFLKVTDEPAYAVLRDEPRMKRIDAIIAANAERERRELLAAGV